MTPVDVGGYLEVMSDFGFVHLRDGSAVDLVVIDQLRGPTSPCEWVEAGRHPDGYSAAWLAGTIPGWFSVPEGWTIEQSSKMKFVDSSEIPARLVGLTNKDGVDVVLDLESGREGFVGRVPPPGSNEPGAR